MMMMMITITEMPEIHWCILCVCVCWLGYAHSSTRKFWSVFQKTRKRPEKGQHEEWFPHGSLCSVSAGISRKKQHQHQADTVWTVVLHNATLSFGNFCLKSIHTFFPVYLWVTVEHWASSSFVNRFPFTRQWLYIKYSPLLNIQL